MLNNNPPRVYGLHYISSHRLRNRQPPQIVVRVDKRYSEILGDVFASGWFSNQLEDPQGYIESPPEFIRWNPSLKKYGYGKIPVIDAPDELWFHFSLDPKLIAETAVDLRHLCWALWYVLGSIEDTPGRRQLLHLQQVCDTRTTPAHAIGGELYPALRRCLLKAVSIYASRGAYEIPQATSAVSEAWHFIRSEGSKKHPELNADLWKDGRFLIQIPNRMAIFISDTLRHDMDEPIPFGSGNVDHPSQQLPLIAGLAALTDWVEKQFEYL